MRALDQSAAILPHFSLLLLLLLPREHSAIQPPERHFWPRPSNALPHLPNELDEKPHHTTTFLPCPPVEINNLPRRGTPEHRFDLNPHLSFEAGPNSINPPTRQNGEAGHNLLVFLRPVGRADCRHRPRKQPAFHIPINCVRPECSLLEGKVGGDVFPSVVDACRESLSSAPLLPPPPPSPGIHSPRAPDGQKPSGRGGGAESFSLSPP